MAAADVNGVLCDSPLTGPAHAKELAENTHPDVLLPFTEGVEKRLRSTRSTLATTYQSCANTIGARILPHFTPRDHLQGASNGGQKGYPAQRLRRQGKPSQKERVPRQILQREIGVHIFYAASSDPLKLCVKIAAYMAYEEAKPSSCGGAPSTWDTKPFPSATRPSKQKRMANRPHG